MNSDTKLQLVERLVDLTVLYVKPRNLHPGEEKTNYPRLQEQLRKTHIDARMRHFSIEQVNALLDFYESDIGRSILESQEHINREFDAKVTSDAGKPFSR